MVSSTLLRLKRKGEISRGGGSGKGLVYAWRENLQVFSQLAAGNSGFISSCNGDLRGRQRVASRRDPVSI